CVVEISFCRTGTSALHRHVRVVRGIPRSPHGPTSPPTHARHISYRGFYIVCASRALGALAASLGALASSVSSTSLQNLCGASLFSTFLLSLASSTCLPGCACVLVLPPLLPGSLLFRFLALQCALAPTILVRLPSGSSCTATC